ncbi:MAG: DnaB-like helicase C-terminal domain-containing protein, partial [Phycisphaerales bacterium]
LSGLRSAVLRSVLGSPRSPFYLLTAAVPPACGQPVQPAKSAITKSAGEPVSGASRHSFDGVPCEPVERVDYDGRRLTEPDDIITAMESGIDAIREGGEGDRDSQCEADLLRSMENPHELRRDKVPVTLGQLGFLLDGGLDPSSLTIIGARPSCGKTSLGLGLCLHASRASDGCASLFASIEMSAQQIGLRLLSMRSGVSIGNIRRGVIDEDAFRVERNKAALAAQNGQPVYILDGCSDVRAIIAHAKRHIRHRDVRLTVVDYLGLCSMPGDFDRHDLRVGAMSKAFKELAVQSGTSVIVLSQLSRASASGNRRPGLSDLRDSGNIEQDADNVILIHRENDRHDDLFGTTLIVAKQRQGDTGDAQVWYRRSTMSYEARHVEPIGAAAEGRS